MEILPIWTKRAKLSTKALDPLSLSRISDYISSNLLPGITTLTTIARNYSFYSWAINLSINRGIKQFKKYIAQLESSWVIAGLLDKDENELFKDAKGPIGNNIARNKIDNLSKDEIFNVQGSILKNPGGGYSQYYTRAMRFLRLTGSHDRSSFLTFLGIDLAKSFEENIKHTKFFKTYIDKKQIPKKVLFELGKIASYLRLYEDSMEEERNKLIDIFFSNNQNKSFIPTSRKSTFYLILKLFEIFTQNKIDLSRLDFRNIIYFGNTHKNGLIIPKKEIMQVFDDVYIPWKLFQFHEYLIQSLEGILITFIKYLENVDIGISEEEFIENHLDFLKEIEKYLEKDTNSKIDLKVINLLELIKIVFKNLKINDDFKDQTSKIFDKLIDFNFKDIKFSEFNLSDELLELLKDEDNKYYSKNIALSILLLIIVLIRYKHYNTIITNNENHVWIHYKFKTDPFSLLSFLNIIENKMNSITLIDFFRLILRKIITRHNNVARRKKINQGNDTFRFKRQRDNPQKYVFQRTYSYEYRSDKFSTIKSLLEDFGFIQKKTEKDLVRFEITERGKKYLGEGLNA